MLNLNAENWEFHDPPPLEAALWRYMDFTKFVSLLEKSELFFARADKLGDPFEGFIPTNNRKDLEAEEKSMYNALSAELRRFTFISCWHESAHESDAMWKIYSSANSGIAIITTCAALVRSFRTNEQMHLGKVRYIDYNSDSEQIPGPQDDWLSAYFHKRRNFAHEQEVRVIIQHVPHAAILNNLENLSTDLRVWGPGFGCEVDLAELIQEVVIDPSAPGWLLELVNLVTERYDLQVPVHVSDLAETPEHFSS